MRYAREASERERVRPETGEQFYSENVSCISGLCGADESLRLRKDPEVFSSSVRGILQVRSCLELCRPKERRRKTEKESGIKNKE